MGAFIKTIGLPFFFFVTFISVGHVFCIKQQMEILSERRKLLSGLQLRASAFTYPPCLSAIKMPSGNYSYFGFCHDVVDWMAEHFNMKLNFIHANLSEIVKIGMAPALIKQIVKNEVDIIPWALAPTPALLQQIDVTIPLRVEDFVLLQQWPKEESRLYAPVKPFSPMVWIIFLLSTGSMVIFMSLLTYINKQSNTFLRAINTHSEYVIMVITGQGNQISQGSRPSLYLMVGLWCLMAVVLTNAYTSTLTSYLTVPKLEPIVNTLEELAANGRIKITLDFESDLSKVFLRAVSGPFKILGDSLRNDPELLIKTPTQGFINVLRRNHAYPVIRTIFHHVISTDLKANKNLCRMTGSYPIPYVQIYSFGLPKASPHNFIINRDLQYLWESGLLVHWLRKYTPNVDKCMLDTVKPRGRMTSISLLDLSSAFLLLGFGVGLSIVVFLLEIVTLLTRKVTKIRSKNSRF